MNRADALHTVFVIAVFALGVGCGAIVNGIGHARQVARLRRTIAILRVRVDAVQPEPRRPLSDRYVHHEQIGQPGHTHDAAASRRGATI
jgi:hypothetical protein